MDNLDAIIQESVSTALKEDVGAGDVTALLLDEDCQIEAEIISREPLFFCGSKWVEAVFHQVDLQIRLAWQIEEGSYQPKPATLCKISGQARGILTAERTALNFLQTLAATATQTWHHVSMLKGTGTQLLDTRKTLPGLRMAQKYAVAAAGGKNHRFGLYDAFLIKENHIKAAGSITKAIQKARALNGSCFLEVEVETLKELEEALNAKPDRILLDNFSLAELRKAVLFNQKYGCPLEASGGISLANIQSIAETGVDFISVGAITKSIAAIDLSLLIRKTL